MVEGQRDVVPVARGARLDDLDRPAARVADVALVARAAGQRPVELQLEAGEPPVVEARVAQNLGRDAALRIRAALLGA